MRSRSAKGGATCTMPRFTVQGPYPGTSCRLHGNGAILVPAERPVRLARLVEQQGSDRPPAGGQPLGNAPERAVRGEQLGHGRTIMQPNAWHARLHIRQRRSDRLHEREGRAAEKHRTIAIET